jgi:hypothetical protein
MHTPSRKSVIKVDAMAHVTLDTHYRNSHNLSISDLDFVDTK